MKSKERLKKDIGLVLRGLRETKSKQEEIALNQTDIAEYAGVSVRYYHKLENGLSMPTVEILMKIAEAYKMPLSDLCKRIEEC